MSMDSDELVPNAVFTVDEAPDKERFDVWKESISCVFDVEAATDIRKGEFNATVDAHILGPVMLARTQTHQQKWTRSSFNIARDGMDHYMLQLFEHGQMAYEDSDGTTYVPQQGLVLYDLSQESVSQTDNFTNLSLIIPRTMLEGALKSPDDQHLRTLHSSEPMVALLRDHMQSLKRQAANMTVSQSMEIAPATIGLVGACLNASISDTPNGLEGVNTALSVMVKRYIENHLLDSNMTPDNIAKAAGISRSKLYQLFEPLGGVSSYIKERRLRRALSLLVDPHQKHRTILEVALDVGFASDSDFSRSFKRRYGVSPRDARSLGLPGLTAGQGDNEALDRRYEQWIRNLSL